MSRRCRCRHKPQLYSSFDALVFSRENDARSQPVVLNNATLDTLLAIQDFDFGTEAGGRVLLGVRSCSCLDSEYSYFGLSSFGGINTVVGDDDLRIPGDIALATQDFLDADTMRVSYESDLHNFEANAIRTETVEGSKIEYLAGFRYVHFSEAFNINSTDLDTGTSDYSVDTENNLFGGQVGLRFSGRHCRLDWGVTGKAGLFGNASSQNTFLADFDNSFVFRDLTQRSGQTAFVGEIIAQLEYRISCRWSLRGGYNLLWLEGVALAPEQLDFSDTPESSQFLDSEGGAFFHGANMGLTARW